MIWIVRVPFLLCTVVLSIFFVFLPSCTKSAPTAEVGEEQKWAEGVAVQVVSNIRKGHPRIYLTPERITELKTQSLSSKKDIFELMKKRMKGPQAALFYVLGEDKALGLTKSREEYGRIAADALMKAIRENNKKTSPDDLAILYDWAYGALTYDEKKAFVDFCKYRIGQKIKIHDGKHHGYRCSPTPRGIIAALSFYGDGIDDAYAKDLLIQGIRDTLLDNLAMEHVTGVDGGFADGLTYINQLGGTFMTFLALGIATNTTFFFDHEVLTRLPEHFLYAMLPFPIGRAGGQNESRYFATFHDNWTRNMGKKGSVDKKIADNIAIAAAEYRRHDNEKKASLYTWILNETYGGIPSQAEKTLSFVLMDLDIKPKSPQELMLPLDEALGWDDEKGALIGIALGKKLALAGCQ